MGIVRVLSTASPMSEADLRIIRSRLETLRLLSEIVAEGLDEVVGVLDKDLAFDVIRVLDALLEAFGAQTRAELERHIPEYRQMDEHALIGRMADTINDEPDLFGVSRGLIVETSRKVCPDDEDEPALHEAKLIFTLRLAELCVFGREYPKLKRAHLRLV